MLLIIDKSTSSANTISDMFRYMGIVSYGTTPENALSELSNRYKAILFINPENMKTAEEIVDIARTYSIDSSILALTKSDNYKFNSLFDAVFEGDVISSRIISDILAYINEAKKNALGTYRLLGIDASINNPPTTYFDTPISLTKTENMILRFLITAYPIPKKAKDILQYAFKPGKLPEPSSIRTHISSINRKFADIAKRHVIFFKCGKGYIIGLC